MQPLETTGDVSMDTEEHKTVQTAGPEIEIYLAYLVFLFHYEKSKKEVSGASQWLETYVTKAQGFNRRTLDLLTAKLYFWTAKLAEEGEAYASIRPVLTNALRTATVRQDIETQVINTLHLVLCFAKSGKERQH